MNDEMLTEKQKSCIPDVTFELIPIKNLVSNQDYQRPLSESHIRKTLAEFDVRQINAVKVSRREGVNYVFDGQHTIEIVAAKSESRDTPVWCMVFEMDYEEEAHIFAEQQKHVKSLVPYEKFIAHIEAGDEKQQMIKSVVESYGLHIAKTKEASGICAVSALEDIYDKYGENVMDSALRLAVATWEGEDNSFSGTILKAIAKIIATFGDSLKEDVFKDHVGKVSVKAIIRQAKERCPGMLGYAETMLILYNTKNKTHLSLKQLYGKRKGNDDDDEEEDEEH